MTTTPREYGAIVLNTILAVLVLLVVGARLYTRHVVQKTIEAEDVLILLSTVRFYIGTSLCLDDILTIFQISTVGALVAVVLGEDITLIMCSTAR